MKKRLFASLSIASLAALTSCSILPQESESYSESNSVTATEDVTTTKEAEKTTTTKETEKTTTTKKITTTEDTTTKSAATGPYSFYDETYDADTFTISKVDALKNKTDFIKGFDLSLAEGIAEAGGKYYAEDGTEESIYEILADSGINTARVRLFYDYTASDGEKSGHLDVSNVIKMLKASQEAGLKTLLDLHYSDYWADPGHQYCPSAWSDYTYEETVTAVYEYTKEVLNSIKEAGITLDYIQIGNEINAGLIWPYGAFDWTSDETKATSFENIAGLLESGIKASREVSSSTKIILHTSDGLGAWSDSEGYYNGGVWFFNGLKEYNLDYDIAASSFYTFYDPNTPVSILNQMIDELGEATGKPVLVMEFSYAFTYAWNENTHNMFYTDMEQPGYPATIQGQANLITDMIREAAESESGIGVIYWGGEWIPLADAELSSNWANQALFTYEGKALPSLRAFKECE